MGKMRRQGTELPVRRRRDLRRRPPGGHAGGTATEDEAGCWPPPPSWPRADADLRRRRPGRSTPHCARRARPAHWSAPRRASPATTSGGRTPGSSRRCSRPGRRPATRIWASSSLDITGPGVWSAAGRDSFVDDVQAMRRRVEDNIPERAARPRAQARRRRAAGRRVRGSAAATRARPDRPRPAAARHVDGAAVADPRRLRRTHRRRRDGRRLHVPAAGRAPAAAAAAAPHPSAARGRCRHGVAGPGRRVHRGRHRVSAAEVFIGRTRSGTPARSAGCTRSCSTGRCCTRSRRSDDEMRLSPGGGPRSAGRARFRQPAC